MAKILVFDKDPQSVHQLKGILAAEGHECVVSPDGYSVIPLAEQHYPRLVILDYNEAAGVEILQRLRKSNVGAMIPVIFASATSKYEMEFSVMDAPAVGYVEKPLDPAKVADAIRDFIGPKRA
ncbi:MAG: response regulator [Elusimicrobia bacterium]|nr:response regulator [Elusimicrobiota bacterium]